jgi:hypothetical protein
MKNIFGNSFGRWRAIDKGGDRKNAGRDAGATGSILSVGAVREEETKRRQGIDLQVICRNSGLN